MADIPNEIKTIYRSRHLLNSLFVICYGCVLYHDGDMISYVGYMDSLLENSKPWGSVRESYSKTVT
jgi:hypothetical protein